MNPTPFLNHDRLWSERLASWGSRRWVHGLAWLLARTGDSWLWALVIGLLVWRGARVGWALLWAAVGTAVIVAIAKGIFKRKRPSGPGRALYTDKYSFPSGHAARATAVAATLSFAWPEWSAAWLVWATAVSLARVVLARHFLSDVAAGALVGLTYGLLLNVLFW
jgi:undecaprenyl-diphosphatase